MTATLKTPPLFLFSILSLAILAPPAQCGEGKTSRKPDPALGGKVKSFVKSACYVLTFHDTPGKEKSLEKHKEKLKGYEKFAWKGLAKAFIKYFFGMPIPGAKSKRELQKKVDDLPVTYYFDLPRGYNPGKPWPLVIALHGGGAGSGDGSEAMGTFGRLLGNMTPRRRLELPARIPRRPGPDRRGGNPLPRGLEQNLRGRPFHGWLWILFRSDLLARPVRRLLELRGGNQRGLRL
ncbi:MAG: hypothetical protein ACYTHM_13065 [Planctomycetota bacterium]|jgi:hypothetical protein